MSDDDRWIRSAALPKNYSTLIAKTGDLLELRLIATGIATVIVFNTSVVAVPFSFTHVSCSFHLRISLTWWQ